MIKKQFLSEDEVCYYLRLTPNTIHQIALSKALPHYLFGTNTVYFDKTDIDSWAFEQNIATDPSSVTITHPVFVSSDLAFLAENNRVEFERCMFVFARAFNEYFSMDPKPIDPVHQKFPETHSPRTLEDLFTDKTDWKKYIAALTETTPPLLSKEWKFIAEGIKGGKTSLANWIELLRKKGIINRNYKRQLIVPVLNNAFSMTLGADGSSMQNDCYAFTRIFKKQLERCI